MKLEIGQKWLKIVFAALLTIAATLLFISPVRADVNVAANPATVTATTNQPNAPNNQSSNGQVIANKTSAKETSKVVGNSNSSNASQTPVTTETSQGSNNQAGSQTKSTEANSGDSNNSKSTQTLPITRSATSSTSSANQKQLLVTEKDSAGSPAPANGREITPGTVNVTLNDQAPGKLKGSIDQYTPMTIRVNFDASGQNVQPGDYFNFSFKGLNVTGGSTFNITNNGQTVGIVTITGDSGRLTFVTEGADAKGYFSLSVQLKHSGSKEVQDVPVAIHYNLDTPTWTVHYVPAKVSPKEIFSKYTMNNNVDKTGPDFERTGSTADDPQYALRIISSNDAEYRSAIIHDHLSTPGFCYDPNSFDIREVKWTWNGSNWDNQTKHQLTNVTPVFTDGSTSFTIDLSHQTLAADSNGFLILYGLLYYDYAKPKNGYVHLNQLPANERPANKTIIHNTASITSNKGKTISYSQTLQIVNADDQIALDDYGIDIQKVDEKGQPVKKAGAGFELHYGSRTGTLVVTDAKDPSCTETIAYTNSEGIASFRGLLHGDYYIQEVQAPAGYQLSSKIVEVTNKELKNKNPFVVTFADPKTPVSSTISKTVTKVWNDNNNQDGLRPQSITVNLLANGQLTKHTVTLSAANNWTANVDNLPEYANGQKINYTWQEANVPAGYTASVNDNTITNTHKPATINKSVTKEWNDNNNQDGLRPQSITVNLLANGQIVKTLTLSASNNWTADVVNLPKYTNGQTINYTWQEAKVPSGYTSVVNGDTIVNTHTPAVKPVTIKKTVTKEWNDNNNQDGLRPQSITVNLLANGQVVKALTLSASNNWTASVDNLPEYANGQAISYTWQEADVPTGYTASVNGNTITNTHMPVTIKKTVTKQWVDGNNQDGLRPQNITVNLLANGQVVKILTLSANNNWTASVDNLPEYANGQAISYTWQEAKVPSGYTASVNGNTITNTHMPVTIKKTVTKEWNDNNDQDGLRPQSITVNLLANGQVVKTLTLSANNNWTASVDNLPEYTNGQAISYTWQEANVPAGYTAVVNGDTITNTHTPVTINKTVTKQWIDGNNQDGLRPQSITVNLLANGQVVKTLTLSANNNWTASVDNLPEYANGQLVNYTWQEANVPAGYTASVNGDTIVNTHTPAITIAKVTKVWNDANNQDGIRPSSVMVQLLANGQVVKTVTLNSVNGWTTTFTDLPIYSQGQKIVYTVVESNVPAGYQSVVSQNGLNFTVINTHQPNKPSQPTKPTKPNKPSQPTKPTKPNKPSQPTKPTKPNKPSQPTKPTKPNKPSQPTKPVQPNKPSQPTKPVQPNKPNKPSQPTKPVQSNKPGQPESGTPEKGTGHGQSRLPQTGSQNDFAVLGLGLLMMSMTIGIVTRHD